jgi:hypothetical protein
LLFCSALFLAEHSIAEPSYYTWVDAQGVVHNTIISSDKKTGESLPVGKSNSKASQSNVIDTADYLSEEDSQKQRNKEFADKKPFFTWTDAQGIIRSELKPDVLVDFVAEEIVYDAVFAPPFRLPDYVKDGLCCEAYAGAFTSLVKFNGSGSYKVDDTVFPFKTQSGDVAAGYFSLPDLSSKEILLLKGYKLPLSSAFEVIALNEQYKPIYLVSELSGIDVEQTWKDVGFKKLMLEVSDPEVKYLVVFVRPQGKGQNNKALSNYSLSVIRDRLFD